VGDEVRLCELYLGIEQLRLGDRLQVKWEIDDSLRSAPMPSLVMQPLVENAGYHGVSRLPGGGCILIAIRTEGGRLQVLVDNPVASERGESAGAGIALNNVAQRLQATFGPGASLRADPAPGRFRVELSYDPEAQQ